MKYIFVLIACIWFVSPAEAQIQKVWLDADTGNEMDDLYAIVRLVKERSIQLVGLSSAHFNNPDLLVFEKWNAYDTKGLNTVERILKNRWVEQNPQDETRIMWDLALVEAYLNPTRAQLKIVKTPPENNQRNIRAYIKIDEKALSDDFWKVIKQKF